MKVSGRVDGPAIWRMIPSSDDFDKDSLSMIYRVKPYYATKSFKNSIQRDEWK